jgi:hypothetical protein
MLPPGLTVDPVFFSHQQALKSIHPVAATVARILAGRCSCDLVRPRLPEPKEDERHLRERYRRLNMPRTEVIAALERHRGGPGIRLTRAEWPAELARFVAEHARNAGPTLYYLHFSSDRSPLRVPSEVRRVGAGDVRTAPGEWLLEGLPTLVTP